MSGPLGHLWLWGSLAAAACATAFGLLGWRSPADRWGARARAALGAGAGFTSLAAVVLATALARGDMGLAYVADHTEPALPTAYKVAAFWAGQEGSLLLWAWLLSAVAAAAGVTSLRGPGRHQAGALGALGLVNAFFAGLLVSAADPFAAAEAGVGASGLNPMLQHWAMVLHPPMLFAGYALAVVPFAVMIGTLASGEGVEHWAGRMRRWALASWTFLTGGIVLGAWWAYVELGWGGYWAWDPVENASLLPWLTGTALVHTLAVDRQRGQLRRWTATLAGLTFVLCLVATYITRSGVIQSVHAFGQSAVGTFFLGAIVVSTAGCGALLVGRRAMLRSRVAVEGPLSREGMTLAADVLLLVIAGVVLLGTLSPVVSGLVSDEPVAVNASFYNRIAAPLGLVLAALMSLGPVLVYGRESGERLRRMLPLPAGLTAALLLGAAWAGVRSPAALGAAGIAWMTILLIATAFAGSLRRASRAHGVGLLGALRRIDNDHRRYGGQLVHAGMAIAVLGIAGSSLYAERAELSLRRGESVLVGGYSARLEGLREVREANYSAVEAVLTVTDRAGRDFELRPQRRFYDMSVQSNAEVAIRTGAREDVYVALLGWEAGGAVAAVQVLVNPLTAWVWIGAAVMFGGGAFCLLPRLAPHRRRAGARVAGARGARPEDRAPAGLAPLQTT